MSALQWAILQFFQPQITMLTKIMIRLLENPCFMEQVMKLADKVVLGKYIYY